MPPSSASTVSCDALIREYEAAQTERRQWESDWQDCADFTQRYTQFESRPTTERVTQPAYKFGRNRVYNEAATKDSRELAAALHGLLFNPSIRWMALANNDDLDITDEEDAWLYDATSRMLAYFNSPASGFGTSTSEVAIDLVCFGTGIHEASMRPGKPLHWHARRISDFFLCESEGVVNRAFRDWFPSIREAYEIFGNDLSADTIAKAKQPGECSQRIHIVHCVFERMERDTYKVDARNKPIASIYIEKDKKHIIREGGFDEFPWLTPRWEKAPEEPYGTSPTHNAMGGIKSLNAIERDTLIAGSLAVRPPMAVDPGMFDGALRTHPGAINYKKRGTRDVPEPIVTGVAPHFGEKMIESREMRIREAYFLDKFKLPDIDRMTAEEVITRRQQALLLASPMLSRFYSEWLVPVVQITFRWMVKAKQFLPPPPTLAGRGLRPTFVSPLALSQKASEASAWTQFVSSISPLHEANPTTFAATVDEEFAIRNLAALHGLNPRYLRTRRQAQQKTAEFQQQAAATQQIEAAQGAAKAASDGASAVATMNGKPGAGRRGAA